MAVSAAVYKIVKRAVEARVKRGDTLDDAIAAYPKLSQEQAEQLKVELTPVEDTENKEKEE